MKRTNLLRCMLLATVFLLAVCRRGTSSSVTVPFRLDHNRMLVDAEIQRSDGTWRKARLWIDSGNPSFFMTPELARDLGIEIPEGGAGNRALDVAPPPGMRIGDFSLDFEGVPSQVIFQPEWLFTTMHNDANLPATLLKKCRVVFDYPNRKLTLAEPGSRRPRGLRAPASVHPETGIVQIDVVIDGNSLSFALDNGASYTFASEEEIDRLHEKNPRWPYMRGAAGHASLWGWWPTEPGELLVLTVPEMSWGSVPLTDVGIAGGPPFFPGGPDLGAWYSHKTARPVNGFLGPNAYASYRVEIDYAGQAVYFKKGKVTRARGLDIVGIILRPEANGEYSVIGIAKKDGEPSVQDVRIGDTLLRVDDLRVSGATMGTVIDALRGTPGERKTLVLEREGRSFWVEAETRRFLPY